MGDVVGWLVDALLRVGFLLLAWFALALLWLVWFVVLGCFGLFNCYAGCEVGVLVALVFGVGLHV